MLHLLQSILYCLSSYINLKHSIQPDNACIHLPNRVITGSECILPVTYYLPTKAKLCRFRKASVYINWQIANHLKYFATNAMKLPVPMANCILQKTHSNGSIMQIVKTKLPVLCSAMLHTSRLKKMAYTGIIEL